MNLEHIPKAVTIHTLIAGLDDQHNDARVQFLRSLSNNLTVRIIGVAQRIMRQNEKAEAMPENETPTLDKRNEMDAFIDGADADARKRDDLGFAPNIDLNAQIRGMVLARDYFAGECVTSASNRYDYPMTFHNTLDFMSKGNGGTPPKPEVIKAIGEATGLSIEDIAKLHNGAQRKRADQLKLDREGILDIISMHSSQGGSEGAFDELDPVIRQKVVVAAASSYQKGVERLAQRIMMGQSTELTTLAVLNKAKPAIAEWVDNLEDTYEEALLEASERNVNFEDVRKVLGLPKKKVTTNKADEQKADEKKADEQKAA